MNLLADAQTATLPLYAEDVFAKALQEGSGAALISPAPDPRLAPAWEVRGTLVAQFRPSGGILSPQEVWYGWLLERAAAPGEFVCVIRGTGDVREWWLDAEIGELTTHPVVGRVEAGFWSIWSSMRYRPAPGGSESPAAQGIAQAVGAGRLTITGHSLGSALATYCAFEVAAPALLGSSRTTAVIFASPRPGDSSFGAAFNLRVPNHRAYWWDADLVPKVPFGFGYAAVPGSIELKPAAGLKICRSLSCAHHLLSSYIPMIDPSVLGSFQATEQDKPFLDCLGLQLPGRGGVAPPS